MADLLKLNTSGIIEFGGANTSGWISNLGFTLAANVFTITDAQGTALSSTNPAHFTVRSATSGQLNTVIIDAPKTVEDDGHGSTTLNMGLLGTTASVAWGSEMPLFIYGYEDPNNAGEGLICFSRSPVMVTTPASANNIGFKGDDPTTSGEDNIFILEASLTASQHQSLPVTLLGSIGVTRGADATDDWTLEANAHNGIGSDSLRRTFATQWTFPGGQNGGITTAGGTNNYATRLYVAGGNLADDVPTWATSGSIIALYHIAADGAIFYEYSTMSAGNCTNGDVAAQLQLAVPVRATGYSSRYLVPFGYAAITGIADDIVLIEIPTSAVRVFDFKATSGGQVQANDFSDPGDDIGGRVQYYGFDPTP
jgi:hypothetical protein